MEGNPGKDEMRAGLPILAFADARAFDAWLGSQGPIAPRALAEARKEGRARADAQQGRRRSTRLLCHGWIDGQLDTYDDHHWLIRFTPRKPRSKWSELNRRRAAELLAEGRMRPAGLAQIEMAKSDGRWDVAWMLQPAPPSPRPTLPPRSTPIPKRRLLRHAHGGQPLRHPLPHRRGEDAGGARPQDHAIRTRDAGARGETLHG